MGTSSTRVFSVDKESRTVVISTDADMQGRDAVELGLKEKSIFHLPVLGFLYAFCSGICQCSLH